MLFETMFPIQGKDVVWLVFLEYCISGSWFFGSLFGICASHQKE